ncbi:magnesium transporter CorA family protein [Weissella coleopterorum]|uniref:Magnesium transporter CorA family protein n=1 Tax=Weissella coleopterorum TaxID=2714949 RepID=A0A6G8AZ78_9LACO|nr:magnesium transporter CorA family protein [Weissella coleopterorum]QIL50183.1 magnesium transporter CorA family protein [Weissella coleopterorum]
MIEEQKVIDWTWIRVHDMQPQERETLNHKYQIANEMINYALDPYESARNEIDGNNVLTIFDIVTPTSDIATTEPVSFITNQEQKFLMTFTRNETKYIIKYIDKILDQSQQNLVHFQPVDILIDTLRILSSKFQTVILEINRRRNPIQRALRESKAVQGKIDELMNLQTDLIYLLNSLHSDNELINNLKNQKILKLTLLQIEKLEDIQVELQQAQDTGELAQLVTNQVEDSYASIANNSLNWTMKMLTLVTVVLTIPTIVSGFYGQNVRWLPFAQAHESWLATIIITIILMMITVIILWRRGFFKR